jgi:hypothetical protein
MERPTRHRCPRPGCNGLIVEVGSLESTWDTPAAVWELSHRRCSRLCGWSDAGQPTDLGGSGSTPVG